MRSLLLTSLLVASVVPATSSAAEPTAAPQPPNIVFMFADDLGYGDLGCYGHPYARTPELDQLAAEGTRFTQFYVTGVTCNPSRTGLMTGVHPARFPRYAADFGFGDRVTITELLKASGYKTGHFGKWHMGPETSDGTYGIDEVDTIGKDKNGGGRDDAVYAAAIKFIRTHRSGPFYVNVWGHATHYPVAPPRNLVRKFRDVVVERDDFPPSMQHKFDESLKVGGNLDEGMRAYLADVAQIDRNVGRLLRALDELGLRENTLVVFSSDHGPAPVGLGNKASREYSTNMLGSAGRFRGGKHEQYEGGVRVPCIMRWPGHVTAGRVDEANVCSFIDWLPTLCAIAGVEELPTGLDGEDRSAVWLGADGPRRSPLFWKTSTTGSTPAVRKGRWKLHLHRRRRGEAELYDLPEDPEEQHNIIGEHPDVAAKLTKTIRRWVAELPDDYEKTEKRRRDEE